MTVTTHEQLFGNIDIYRLIVDNAEEGIWISDSDDRITFINKKLVDLLGYDQDDIIGKHMYEFADETNQAIMRESLISAREGKKNTHPFKIRSKSGEQILLLVATTPMFDKKGKYLGVLGLGSDISTQLKIEETLREAKSEAELYVDVLSHDINNMHQVALGYLEMAKGKLDSQGKLESSDEPLIDKSIEALKNSTQLISNIKSLREQKLGRIRSRTIDIGNMLAEVKVIFSGIPGRKLAINYIPISGCYVDANELLKEVFINLVGNAIKHSTGPLTIDIKVDIVTKAGKRYCHVIIEDNGPGIPDIQKRKIFERFTPGGKYPSGRGLGLYLINTLIEDFNGRVWMEDRVPGDYHKGSRFVVMLPSIEK